jgi:hypothetical protein
MGQALKAQYGAVHGEILIHYRNQHIGPTRRTRRTRRLGKRPKALRGMTWRRVRQGRRV